MLANGESTGFAVVLEGSNSEDSLRGIKNKLPNYQEEYAGCFESSMIQRILVGFLDQAEKKKAW